MSINTYRKNPNYFLNYFLINILFFAVADFAILKWDLSVTIPFQISLLLLFPIAVLFGLIGATAFHNASHGNIRPKWLNTFIGEFAGAYTLEGMRTFRVGHQLHHMYADNPERDPHPPIGKSFSEFLLHSRQGTIECLKNEYFKYHGKTTATAKHMRWQIFTFNCGVVLKISFWFFLFGPVLFSVFFIPSYLAYFFGFGHLNYISHLPDADGVVRVKNHEHGLYFTLMNKITSGGYFHGSHHKAPWLYNPSHLKNRKNHETVSTTNQDFKETHETSRDHLSRAR